MKFRMLLAAAFALAASLAHAVPYAAVNPADKSGTISSTGVYQTVATYDANRSGCTIQNQGTHTMTIRVGGVTLWSLPAGQQFYCNSGGVIVTSLIEITGTSGDAFAAAFE